MWNSSILEEMFFCKNKGKQRVWYTFHTQKYIK